MSRSHRRFLSVRLSVAAIVLVGASAVWLRAQSGPPMTFGLLRPFPDAIPVATPSRVAFSVEVDTGIIDPRTVQLYRMTEAGELDEALGLMLDDGIDGDRKAGDRVFTRAVVIHDGALETRAFQVMAFTRDTGRAIRSTPAALTTFQPGGASREGNRIVFRDRTGEVDLDVPLQDRVETSVHGDIRVTRTDRLAFSEDRSHVLVFGRVSTTAGDVRRWFTQSTARLFDARGALWEFVAQPGRILMPSDYASLASGARRVALISRTERGRDPRVYVYDRTGELLFATPEDLFDDMKRVELSGSGQYLLVQGTLARKRAAVVRVFDVETSRSWQADATGGLSDAKIASTDDGRFSVTLPTAVSVLPPRG